MELAVNPQTGARLYREAPGAEWRPVEMARNPESGALIMRNPGTGGWEPVPGQGEVAVPPPADTPPTPPELMIPQPSGRTRGDLVTGARQYQSGVNEGIAGLAGLPGDALNGAANIGVMIRNGIERLFGRPGNRPGVNLPIGTEAIQSGMAATDMTAPPVEGYETVRRAGELTSSFGVPAGIGARAQAQARALLPRPGAPIPVPGTAGGQEVRAAVMNAPVAGTAAAIVGEMGEGAAESAGLPPVVGQIAGELAGGIAPTGLRSGAETAFRNAFDEPGRSEGLFYALERQNVTPSFGLIGNQNAASAENIVQATPFAGYPVARRWRNQVQQTEDARDRVTAPAYDGVNPPAVQAQGAYAIGDRAQTYLAPALPRINRELNNLQAKIINGMGGKTQALDVRAFLRFADRTMPTLDTQGQAVLRGLTDELRTMRRTPIDRTLHATLNTQRASLASTLAGAPPQAQASIQRQINRLDQAIDANLGVRNDQFDMWRSRISKASATGAKLDNVTEHSANENVKGIQRGASADPAEYDAAMAGKRRLASKRVPLAEGGDKPFVQDVLGKQPQVAYAYLTTPEGVGRLIALQRNLPPEQWDVLAADIIREFGRGTRAGTRNSDMDFSPANFAKRWQTLPPQAQEVLFPNPALRADLNDLAEIANAQVRRGAAANPSGSATTAIGATTLGGLIFNPAQAAPFVAAMGLAGSGYANTRLTKIIADQYPRALERLTTQAGAVGAGSVAAAPDMEGPR